MASRYQFVVVGDTPDADVLKREIAAFVEQLETHSSAKAALEIVTAGKPEEAIDVAREPVTIRMDLTDKAAPIVVSIRDGKFRGVGASIESATSDLAATVAEPAEPRAAK